MVVHSKKRNSKHRGRIKARKHSVKSSKKRKPKAKPVPAKPQKKRPIPYGIKVLISYSALLGAFYLIFSLLVPTTIIFGQEISGTLATLINLFFVALIFLMVQGFILRRLWSYRLALVLYAFSILNSIISLFFIQTTSLNIISGLVTATSLLTIVMNALTAWYVTERKDYFTTHTYYEDIRMVDKVFVSSIYMFYFFSVLMAVVIGFQFYNNVTLKVDAVMDELNGKTYSKGLEVCENIDADSRDICYISLAAMYASKTDTRVLCDKVNDNFYKFTCNQAAS